MIDEYMNILYCYRDKTKGATMNKKDVKFILSGKKKIGKYGDKYQVLIFTIYLSI